jgi:NAD(P)-dependent dehydrogenase (short-subunit alcohol dehydrogenase family)
VKRLFAQVKKEQKGRLDILVNNATFLHDKLIEKGPFWEKPLDLVDILDVGLRSAYVASWYAAPLMAARKNGLIAFTSSFGASCYMHGPGYGAQKAGVDKFAKDMAVDLKPFNVAAVSIWMGMLKTDRTKRVMDQDPQKYAPFWEIAETPEFTGALISAIYRDSKRADKSGQVLIGAEAALDYGIKDEGGKQPPSHRQFLGAPTQAHPAIVE